MSTLYSQWMNAREGKRTRDIAAELGVSEAQLVASAIGGDGAVQSKRLAYKATELLPKLTPLGPLKTITRNEAAVIEIEGTYANFEFFEKHGMGQAVGAIDLRIFLRHWHKGFWMLEETKRGPRESLQFFDASGQAIHKVHVTPKSDAAGFRALVLAHLAEDQTPSESVEPAPAKPAELADADVDVAGFRKGWSEMKDTHAFFGLMNRFKLSRTQALRLAGEEYSQALPVDCLGTLLDKAAAIELPIMFFVGNPGLIQIHTGPVRKIVTMDDWWNVLDPSTNLHVRRELVHSAWIVRKPTADGIVTSVELYDAAGESILYVFGERKPGQVEKPAWRELAESLRSS